MTTPAGTVAVIRRGASDSPHLLSWVRELRYEILDVKNWSDVHITNLGSDGDCSTRLAGIPINRFDLIFFLGVPGSWERSVLSERDHWYRNAERRAALQAALAGTAHPYIINRGDALLWGRQLADPLSMLRRLGCCGWNTPVLHRTYITSDDDHIPAGPQATRDSGPTTDASVTEKRLAVFTRRGEPFMADSSLTDVPADVIDKAEAMRSLLDGLDLDWATVAVGTFDNRTFAFGMRPWLPASLGANGFVRAMNTVAADVVQNLGGRL